MAASQVPSPHLHAAAAAAQSCGASILQSLHVRGGSKPLIAAMPHAGCGLRFAGDQFHILHPSRHDIWETPELDGASPKSASMVIMALLWNIWKAWNALVFRSEHQSTTQVLKAVAADLQLWVHRAKPEDSLLTLLGK